MSETSANGDLVRDRAARVVQAASIPGGGLYDDVDNRDLPYQIAAAALILGAPSGSEQEYLNAGTPENGWMVSAVARTLSDPSLSADVGMPRAIALNVVDEVEPADMPRTTFPNYAMEQRDRETARVLVQHGQRHEGVAGERAMNVRMADFNDFGTPLFKPVDGRFFRQVDDLLSKGRSTGHQIADDAILAHDRLHIVRGTPQPFEVGGVPTRDPRSLTARARLLADIDGGLPVANVTEAVTRIDADRQAMWEGARAMNFTSMGGSSEDRIQSKGEYHRLPADAQQDIFRRISTAEMLPPMRAVRFGLEALTVERERERERVQRHVDLSAHHVSQGQGV